MNDRLYRNTDSNCWFYPIFLSNSHGFESVIDAVAPPAVLRSTSVENGTLPVTLLYRTVLSEKHKSSLRPSLLLYWLRLTVRKRRTIQTTDYLCQSIITNIYIRFFLLVIYRDQGSPKPHSYVLFKIRYKCIYLLTPASSRATGDFPPIVSLKQYFSI